MSAAKIELAKTKREKALLFVLVIIIVIGVYFYIFLRPAIISLSDLLPKVSTLKRDLADAKHLIENKPLIEKERDKLQLKINKYQQTFPRQQEIQRLLENLSKIASESDVKIIGIKPLDKEGLGVKKKKAIYQEFPIEIIAKSGYHQLGKFLQKLEGGERFIMVKDIEITTDPDDIKRQNTQLLASTYILVKK